MTKFFPWLTLTGYYFYSKISSFIPVLYIRIVLDSFYLLVFYSKNFSTWISRLPWTWILKSLLGCWSNHDEDENDNVKKELVLRAKQQLCTCITLLSTFLWRPLHHYRVKRPNVTFFGGRGHTTTNFPFSIWTWIKPWRVQLQETSPTFDQLSGSKERDKVWEDANSFF